MAELEAFGQWLKRQRKARDLTREALARRAHCSASAIRRLEAGDLRASHSLAEALAAALEIPAEQRAAFIQFARGDAKAMTVDDGRQTDASVSRPPSSVNLLPAPLTSFVGRNADVAAVCDLLRETGVRLVTLTGPPGIGKTRLSLAIAHALSAEYAEGARFIALDAVHDADLFPAALAEALGVREAGGALLPALREFLRPQNALLVLDNFEQVISAAPLLTDLLTHAPRLKMLVTSREVLRVYGEHEFPLAALAVPDVARLPTTLTRPFIAQYPSLRLFADRARAAQATFRLTPDNAAEVARLCAWLDGLPLAIEMAAAHVKWIPLPQLLQQLSQRLLALTGGPRDLSPRQQSLTGAIDWSYDLLSPVERQTFALMGVFAGGAEEAQLREVMETLEIREFENSPILQSSNALVEKSLLQYELSAPPRYGMLESVREYALEKLRGAGQWAAARRAHAESYLRLALAARPHLVGGGEQPRWLNRLEAEHANLRAGLEWAIAEQAEMAQTLTEVLFHFWSVRGYLTEGRRWLDKTLALPFPPSELRARLLNYAGRLAQMQGDYSTAQTHHEHALALQESLSDDAGRCRSLENLAILAGSGGNYPRAGELLEQALAVRRAQAVSDPSALMPSLNNLAIVQRRLGNLDRAEALYRETADIARAPNALKPLSHALHGLGEVRMMRDDYSAALACFRESLSLRHQLGNRTDLYNSFGAMAMAWHSLGEMRRAAQLMAHSEQLRAELGIALQPSTRAEVEENIAAVRAALGEAAFASAWAEGQRLTLAEAVALALEQ